MTENPTDVAAARESATEFREVHDRIKAEVARRGWWSRESRPEVGSQYIFVHDPNGYDIEILQAR